MNIFRATRSEKQAGAPFKPAFGLSGIAILLLSVAAFAAGKDDMFNQATQAANANKIEDAANLFCAVAKQDPNFHNGEAAQNCKIYQDQVNRENARNEERFTDGVNFFNQGLYDNAESKFRAIHSGPHLAEAQQYLNSKIPSAKSQAAQAAGAAALDAKFEQGVQAYNNNAFSNAQGLFQQVTGGSHQSEAQSYLQKIQQYQQFVQQGDTAAGSKNYSAAINAYQQAANIKGDGPGDPNSKISMMKTLMAAAGSGNAGGGGGGQQTAQQSQPQPTHQVANAVVQSTQHLDVRKLMKEADAAKRKGDYGTARGKYAAIMAQDPSNADAQSAIAALPAADASQKASSDADVLLARGIGEFYSGSFEDAEVHIKDYIAINGAKSSLAYFYRAASRLTRYYLHGEKPEDHHLLTEAQDDFKSAKKNPSFKPPQDVVSPKIIKVFDQTT